MTRAHGSSTRVLPDGSHVDMSNYFEGTGISNSNGNFRVHGDLVVNHGRSPATTEPDNAGLLLQSLHFDEMDARHLSIRTAFANTCSWFMQTEAYKQWEEQGLSRSKEFLWIKGKPGAGKSTLMKFLLDQLQSQIRKTRNHVRLISFFFNARGNDLEKSIVGMYRSLLFQLLDRSPELWHLLDNIRPGHQWTVESLQSLFEESMQELENTSIICIIDALDECNEQDIRDMVDFLSGLIERGSRLSICFASRHYPHITIETGLSIVLEDRDEHRRDVATYLSIALRIGRDPLAEQIRSELQEKACGVFLWVVLVVGMLNREYDAGRKHCLQEKLRQLPGNLHALFHEILVRDTDHQSGLLLCIQWVLFAKLPLTPRQLYLAVLSGSEPAHLADCHSDEFSEDVVQRYILSNSKGLLEFTKSKKPTVQFIHESVRDFLLKEDGLSKVFPELGANIHGQSHEAIKQCCLKYMSIEALLQLKGSSRKKPPKRFPLLEYANHGVLYHADQAHDHGITQTGFLTDFPRSTWVKHHNILQRYIARRYTPNASLFYILAEAGMTALVRAYSLRQSCFEVEDERYGCPILAATATKNNTTAEVMLELQAQNIPNFCFLRWRAKLPLELSVSYAPSRSFTFKKQGQLFYQLVEHGTELVSLFFLATETCETEARGRYEQTALMHAAFNGFNTLVKELLQLDANASAADIYGHTPLHMASFRGRVEVARLLLNHGVDVSAADNDGETPLHEACSQYGTAQIVELLLHYGADVSAADNDGETPLHAAAAKAKVEVAKPLLDHGADVLSVARYGWTPLKRALFHGKFEMHALLLSHGAYISAAAENGEMQYDAAGK